VPTLTGQPGPKPAHDQAFSPGQLLAGRYELRRRLGEGGMAEVWQAFDLKLRVEVALDPSGAIVVTGDEQGAVRVGPADGGEPHVFLGPAEAVPWTMNPLAVSPDGRWIAWAAGDEIRLWPMPDVTRPPLHTLPLDELLAKLHDLTNVRVVEDEASPSGYRIDIGPFPGWQTAPTW